MKKLLLATLVGSMVLCTQVNAKPDHPPFKAQNMIHTLHQLDLSKEQRKAIRQLVRDFHDSQKEEDGDQRPHGQLRKHHPDFDTMTSEEIAQQASERWADMKNRRLAVAQLQHNVWTLLTTEQQAEFDTIIAERKEKMMARMEARKAEREERPLPFSELDLTDEQASEISALVEAQKDAHKTTRFAMKTLHEQEALLIKQATLDEVALSVLLDSFEDTMVSQAVSRAETHQKMLAVLTDEQREELQEIKELAPKGKRGHHRPPMS